MIFRRNFIFPFLESVVPRLIPIYKIGSFFPKSKFTEKRILKMEFDVLHEKFRSVSFNQQQKSKDDQ